MESETLDSNSLYYSDHFGAACLWIVPSIEVHNLFPFCMWWILLWIFSGRMLWPLSVCHNSAQISLDSGVEDWRLASVHSTICGQK